LKNWGVFLISVLIAGYVFQSSFADEGERSYKDWSVRFEEGRVFYTTHGTEVYGHEFGFFKAPGYCGGGDTIWITYSSDNDEVLNYIGKGVVFRLTVDGKSFRINLNMLDAGKLTPVTKIMSFTNSYAGDDLIAILNKGRELTLEIIGPKDFVKSLDIKKDEFSLNGFIAARLKAKVMCDMVTLK